MEGIETLEWNSVPTNLPTLAGPGQKCRFEDPAYEGNIALLHSSAGQNSHYLNLL